MRMATTAVPCAVGQPLCERALVGGDGSLHPHETTTVKLKFLDPSNAAINYTARVLNVTPAP